MWVNKHIPFTPSPQYAHTLYETSRGALLKYFGGTDSAQGQSTSLGAAKADEWVDQKLPRYIINF